MKPVVAMILAASVAGCLTTDYGAENGQTVSQSEIGMLVAEVKHQLMRCWVPPAGIPAGTMLMVKVRFELNRDGTLARDPVALPVNSGDLQNAYFQPAAKSALRAVRACTPFRLPAALYKYWEDIEIIFDPKVAHR
jgi:colicin import membrane protein